MLAQDLPLDVLCEIFRAIGSRRVHFPPPSITTGAIPGLDSLPWSLTRLCSQWRQAALHTPKLWSAIVLDNQDKSTLRRFGKFLKIYRPISATLTVDCKPGPYGLPSEPKHGKAKHLDSYVFERYGDRFGALSLEFVRGEYSAWPPTSTRMKNVCSLTLKVNPDTVGDYDSVLGRRPEDNLDVVQGQNPFNPQDAGRTRAHAQQFPNLRHLKLVGVDDYLKVDFSKWHLEWKQLTHLSLDGIVLHAPHLLDLLSVTSQTLVRLDLDDIYSGAYRIIPTTEEPFTSMKALQCLKVRLGRISALEIFTKCIALPSLKKLQLRTIADQPNEPGDVDWWYPFIHRINPGLESFDTNIYVPPQVVDDMFERMSQLSVFRAPWTVIPPERLKDIGSGLSLPSLSRLAFFVEDVEQARHATKSLMLRKKNAFRQVYWRDGAWRWGYLVPVQIVEVVMPSNVALANETQARSSKLMELGVSVRVAFNTTRII